MQSSTQDELHGLHWSEASWCGSAALQWHGSKETPWIHLCFVCLCCRIQVMGTNFFTWSSFSLFLASLLHFMIQCSHNEPDIFLLLFSPLCWCASVKIKGFGSVSLTLLPERQDYRQDILHSDSPLLAEVLYTMGFFGPWESALFLTELCLTGQLKV